MLDKQVIMLYIYNYVKKNLQIIEEGLHFQSSKEEIIVSLVRSTCECFAKCWYLIFIIITYEI